MGNWNNTFLLFLNLSVWFSFTVENPKRWLFVDIFMSSFSCHNEPPAQFVWDAVRGETITSWNIESQLEIVESIEGYIDRQHLRHLRAWS